MFILSLLAAQAIVAPDGARLEAGEKCYAIVRGETPIGATRQTVKAVTAGGVAAWDVVVHQKIGDGRFDLRDHFVLRRADLAPIAFDSRKLGIEHVRVVYSAGKLVTTRPGAAAQETALAGPVWEGNLWGLAFAALPLRDGARFELPFYQYDRGLGRFSLQVIGSERVAERDAWIVEATSDGTRKVRYFIDKANHAELGYAGSGFAQRLGGDCSGIPA